MMPPLTELPEPFRSLPALVSYPRVGSHWLKCALELYFERPCMFGPGVPDSLKEGKQVGRLTLIDPERNDWLFCHVHDPGLRLKIHNPLYMWRDPVDTIFSHMRADRAIDHAHLVKMYSNRMRLHLAKYMIGEHRAKEIVSYEALVADPVGEFRKAVHYLDPDRHYSEKRALEVLGQVTKQKLVAKGRDNKRFGSYYGTQLLDEDYESRRQVFRAQFASEIYETVRKGALADLIPVVEAGPPVSPAKPGGPDNGNKKDKP